MFIGSINRYMRCVVESSAKLWKGLPVYVACSGNFTIERILHKCGVGAMQIDRLLVDSGWKQEIVAAVKHKAGGATMMLYKGFGIRAGARPMSQYTRKPGETHGHHWYMPSVQATREFPYVGADVNWWKSFVHSHLQTAPGDPGALMLFGEGADDHWLFAEHVAKSEYYVVTQGYGREVQEWRQFPHRPDNHWFDCLVGSAVAASMLGVKLPGQEAAPVRQRKRYTQEDLRRW